MRYAAFMLLILILTSGCSDAKHEDILPKDLTKEELSILEDVRSAFESKKPDLLQARIYTEQMRESFLEHFAESLSETIKKGMTHLELQRVVPPEKNHILADGLVTEWTLPLKWKLYVHHPSNQPFISYNTLIPLSENSGRILLIHRTADLSSTD